MKHSDKVLREAMKQLGFERHEISDRMSQYKDLSKMTDEEKSKLKSYCWKNGSPRCDDIGITDVKITPSIDLDISMLNGVMEVEIQTSMVMKKIPR